jgi:uncharacterized protein
MQTTLLAHAIEREFPELTATVVQLKATDPHFAQLLAQHDALDSQITNDEMRVAAVGDVSLENWKRQRLQLKDALYRYAKVSYNRNIHLNARHCILE